MPSDEPVQELSRDECRELLKRGELGRLATAAGGEPDIFPVNYFSDGDRILIRTAPGTKLLELTVHSAVAFETDGYTEDEAWSVVVHGRADRLMRPTGGKAVARAAKNSRLHLIDGMGHDLPRPLWDEILGELSSNFGRV